jgi:hypothetical protein
MSYGPSSNHSAKQRGYPHRCAQLEDTHSQNPNQAALLCHGLKLHPVSFPKDKSRRHILTRPNHTQLPYVNTHQGLYIPNEHAMIHEQAQ